MRNEITIEKVIDYAVKENVTLLGIGPMSRNIMEVALEVGKEYDCPTIFIASRNQVDSDTIGGGYVCGWNQSRFIGEVREYTKKIESENLIYVCRDHGGPWQRDEEKRMKVNYDQAVKSSNNSLIEDLKAGFNLLHVDPTINPNKDHVNLNEVINRAVEIIEYTEKQRMTLSLPAVAYEIGTEENAGGVISGENIEKFIISILMKLDSKGLPRPSFIVGQTGTLVKMDYNAGKIDIESTKELIRITRKYGIGFKQHNTDYLGKKILSLHPAMGITAANVAPEFGVVETKALLELAHKIGNTEFESVLSEYIFSGAKWRKWLDRDNIGISKDEILTNYTLKERIIGINAHYYFHEDEIITAQENLYKNLRNNKILYPEEIVRINIKKSILKYVKAFGLINSSSRIHKLLLSTIEYTSSPQASSCS